MREDFWDFDPSHSIIVHTNHKPIVRGTDEGIWRRLRFVPFAVVIPEEQRDTNSPNGSPSKGTASSPGSWPATRRGKTEDSPNPPPSPLPPLSAATPTCRGLYLEDRGRATVSGGFVLWWPESSAGRRGRAERANQVSAVRDPLAALVLITPGQDRSDSIVAITMVLRIQAMTL